MLLLRVVHEVANMVIRGIKGMDIKGRHYRSEERRPIGGVLVGLALLLGSCGYALHLRSVDERRNDPETYEGFDKELLAGYTPVGCELPTKGDVIRVERLPDKQYQTVTLDDETIKVSGMFEYEIRPQKEYGTHTPEDTDMNGHSPARDGAEYWRDVREGAVILQRATSLEQWLQGT